MAVPNPPYFVEFSADPASSATIDHSQKNPGGHASSAGHTSISIAGNGALTAKPEMGAPRANGQAPYFFRSVNVYFRLTDYVITIASDYRVNSCAYDATMRHEVSEHILKPTGIMFEFRDRVIVALNAIRLPTQDAPRWLLPSQIKTIEDDYMSQVGHVVQNFRNQIWAAMQRAKIASDAPDQYNLVYRQCPAGQW